MLSNVPKFFKPGLRLPLNNATTDVIIQDEHFNKTLRLEVSFKVTVTKTSYTLYYVATLPLIKMAM